MEKKSLQEVVDILRAMAVREVQDALSEFPLLTLAAHDTQRWTSWLERPVQLALEHGLPPIAQAIGADPQELLTFIHPRCESAIACFERVTVLRPDRVWGGEIMYICRTIRPYSFRWSGPWPVRMILVEGRLETDRNKFHAGHRSSALVVEAGTTCYVTHPSTVMMHASWITHLVSHACAARIPVRLATMSPPASRRHGALHPMTLANPTSRELALLDQPLRHPKI